MRSLRRNIRDGGLCNWHSPLQEERSNPYEKHIKLLSMEIGGAVYILANQHHTILYTGVTSDLLRRMYEHKTGKYKNSFSNRYNLHKLVYYEGFQRIEDAIVREKQIKAGSRKKKETLINALNPEWKDLSYDIGFED